MKAIWVKGLCLLLALLATGGYAQETSWRPEKSQPAAAPAAATRSAVASLGRPVPAARLDRPQPVSGPVASLAMPMPAAAKSRPNFLDRQVQTASFFPSDRAPRRIVVKGEEPVIIEGSPTESPAPLRLASPGSPYPLPAPRPLPAGSPELPFSNGLGLASPTADDVVLSPGPAPVPLMPGDPTFNQFCDVCGLGGGEGACCGDACCCDACCCDNCCSCCDNCCGDNCCCCCCSKWWVRGEYLMWWMRKMQAPALVTTSPQDSLGVIGNPGTSVAFGGPIDFGTFHGGRFNAGFWLDDCQSVGLEGTFFFLGKQKVQYQAESGGDPLIARPFYDVLLGRENAEEVANLAGILQPSSGQVAVNASSRLWGAEANGLVNLFCGCKYSVYGLAGFRYLDLREDLSVAENVFLPDPNTLDRFVISDQFSTHNQFCGGQLGLRAEMYWRRWQLDLTGKCAVGSTHQIVNINGQTVFIQNDAPTQVFAGGLLTGPGTNIGIFTANRFSVVPEVGCNIGYQLTDNWRIYAGYNLLYWTNVARPGDQIDRGVNTTRNGIAYTVPGNVPTGPLRPAPLMVSTDTLYHGANAGLEFRY